MRVLLVSGSRSLERDISAAEWAQSILLSRIGALPDGSCVIAGGAIGPDSWAAEFARAEPRRLNVAVYVVEGSRYRWKQNDGALVVDAWNKETNKDPLKRNEAMVSAASAMLRRGHDVRLLALVNHETHRPGRGGTDHTVRLAMDAGIPLERLVWRKS